MTTMAPTLVVGLARGDRLDDLVDHLGAQRVAPVRVVEREDRDAIASLRAERHRQSRTTAGEWRKKASTSRS